MSQANRAGGQDFLRDSLPGGSPGFEWSREAAAAFSRGRKPMEPGNPPAEPRRRRQQSSLVFDLRQAGPPPCRADHSRKNSRSLMKTNHEWTRINTNRPEDRWTSFNHNWRQNASALLSRWCDPVMGGSPPGSAGVPPAQILSQLRPSPPPESTGSGALPLLRPGPCGSRRQGGRLQHRRETERQPKGQHAGGTPALPGGVVPMVRWEVSGGRLHVKAGLSPLGNSRLPASRAPAPRDWADPSRRTIN